MLGWGTLQPPRFVAHKHATPLIFLCNYCASLEVYYTVFGELGLWLELCRREINTQYPSCRKTDKATKWRRAHASLMTWFVWNGTISSAVLVEAQFKVVRVKKGQAQCCNKPRYCELSLPGPLAYSSARWSFFSAHARAGGSLTNTMLRFKKGRGVQDPSIICLFLLSKPWIRLTF